jgi:hypothetical protein
MASNGAMVSKRLSFGAKLRWTSSASSCGWVDTQLAVGRVQPAMTWSWSMAMRGVLPLPRNWGAGMDTRRVNGRIQQRAVHESVVVRRCQPLTAFEASVEVVHGDMNVTFAQLSEDEGFDPVPAAAGQTTPDPGHVYGGIQSYRLVGERACAAQRLGEVPDGAGPEVVGGADADAQFWAAVLPVGVLSKGQPLGDGGQ